MFSDTLCACLLLGSTLPGRVSDLSSKSAGNSQAEHLISSSGLPPEAASLVGADLESSFVEFIFRLATYSSKGLLRARGRVGLLRPHIGDRFRYQSAGCKTARHRGAAEAAEAEISVAGRIAMIDRGIVPVAMSASPLPALSCTHGLNSGYRSRRPGLWHQILDSRPSIFA